MKLLIITQIVDSEDPVLGFFHSWLVEFAKRTERLTVICLKEGRHQLPGHVKVLSLGKEKGVSRLTYLFRFYRYVFLRMNEYESVFVHMNPEYVVLGGVFWKLMRKKIVLWYTHRQVTLRLRIATMFSNIILTAAKESFNIQTPKLHVVGHGIDTQKFGVVFRAQKPLGEPLRLISVGRITPIKNLDVFLVALSALKNDGILIHGTLAGAPAVHSDELYLDSLKRTSSELSLEKNVSFVGNMPLEDLPKLYGENDISVNLTPTGGIDKVVLESIASGTLPITSNQAFKPLFGKYAPELLFKEKDAEDLVLRIKGLVKNPRRDEIRTFLHGQVEQEWSTSAVVSRIVQYL